MILDTRCEIPDTRAMSQKLRAMSHEPRVTQGVCTLHMCHGFTPFTPITHERQHKLSRKKEFLFLPTVGT